MCVVPEVPKARVRWTIRPLAVSLQMACLFMLIVLQSPASGRSAQVGREIAVPAHLQDGREYRISIEELIAHGQKLFTAMFTVQEGAGRPLSKGTGNEISDPSEPLVFPRNFNRISGPDSNSCAGCHNKPFVGGGGDIVANVFVLGQRFDFASFDRLDNVSTRGSLDERGEPVTLQSIANSRKTTGMFGSGFIEMLARQITADLQTIRDRVPPGGSQSLESKGISFGVLSRRPDGSWDTSACEGLPAPSLSTAGHGNPPSLIIQPFHQAGAVISLRQFTNNAFNQHHGLQPEERFGIGVDADGDGFVNELTRADITAVTIFQATLPVPGRVIPDDPEIKRAIGIGEERFKEIGCADCHIASLPLDKEGWVFTEPDPYNPPGNLRAGDAPALKIDLTSNKLPQPRLKPDKNGIVWVPAFTDFKLHDITTGPDDPNVEALDMIEPAGSPAFFAGCRMFITHKLWGIANQHPFGHHGLYTTMREAVLAHAGEAEASGRAFRALSDYERDALVEFLKSLQVLPPGTKHLIVEQKGKRQDSVN